MNTKSHMNSITAISGFALIGLLFATDVDAQTENVAVEVTFVAVITIGEDSPLQFGLLDAAMLITEEVIIAPNDGLTDADFNVVSGSQLAADLTIDATAGAGINILIDNIVIPGTPDYSLTAWRCEYDVVAAADCDVPAGGMNVTAVASGALRVGVTLTSIVASITAGNQDGTFDVTVTYQ